ncbi:hypothetical protein HYPSUDRAFT_40906 [Hypholoma sublateritium FD-334 SS-4]|uniref:Uncharacterized protein n=1 Tax=Hypholoma sublateritium (strain FD-334 SS-4) TaxID=945553 RepID=A0A0D2L6E7_HYPSF|nr:hypothetical protein HYPSUDRAFT_40906 [Hypholoma sublateritium FD-334 SS-4]
MELLGTFLAAVAFGIIVVLVVSTIQVLLGDTCIYGKPMRTTLLCYIFFMLLLALLASVQQIAFVIRRVLVLPGAATTSSASPPQLHQTFALPFCIWGADAFLIWRCTLLYKGISRVWTVLLFLLLFIVSICSLGTGILFFFSERFISTRLYNLPTILAVSSSGLVNITLRTVIIGRIVYHQQYIRKAMGVHYASIYTKIISMCVESCLMTSFCGAVFLGLYFSNDHRRELASVVPLTLFPHTCVITPLLLIYRAAKGRSITDLAISGPITASTIARSDEDAKEGMEFSNHVSIGSTGMLSSFTSSLPSTDVDRYAHENAEKGQRL